MATEVPGKVESKIKRRVDTTRDAVKREVDIARTFVRDVTGLKPVKAVIDVGVDTLDNIGDWLKRQAELTREWAG